MAALRSYVPRERNPIWRYDRLKNTLYFSAYHLTPANLPMERLIAGVSGRYGEILGTADAGHVAALKQLWLLTYREASTLAFADAFRAIMIAFIVATLLVPLLRKVVPPKAPLADAH